MKKSKKLFLTLLRFVAAIILIQTLYFKFSGHPESVYIFSTLGMEPIGRIGIGILELIAAVLLLLPRLAWAGAVLGIGLMSGAIFFHLTILGIQVQGDGGLLFALALTVMLCNVGTLYFNYPVLISIKKKLFEK